MTSALRTVVGAWILTTPHAPPLDLAGLGAVGCSELKHGRHPRFAQRASETTAHALVATLPFPRGLVLIPGHAYGEEIAARLAALWTAPWIPDALTLGATRAGILEITAALPDGKLCRTIRPTHDGVSIVTMRAGVSEIRRGSMTTVSVREFDVGLDDVPELTSVEAMVPADPAHVDLVDAERIVAAGRGAGGPEGVALVAALADALHASLGASRMAVDLGWVPPVRQVGQTGRTVNPELYVACGISGASHHLQGMRRSRHIVTINPDRNAPIHELAHLAIHDDLHRIIPLVISALEKRQPSPVTA